MQLLAEPKLLAHFWLVWSMGKSLYWLKMIATMIRLRRTWKCLCCLSCESVLKSLCILLHTGWQNVWAAWLQLAMSFCWYKVKRNTLLMAHETMWNRTEPCRWLWLELPGPTNIMTVSSGKKGKSVLFHTEKQWKDTNLYFLEPSFVYFNESRIIHALVSKK